MKSFFLNLMYKLKYARRHLKIAHGARILGKYTEFEGYNRIGKNSRFHGKIGFGSYIGESSHLHATIGRFCCIGDRVYTVSGVHPTEGFVSVHPAFYSTAKQAGITFTKENCFDETRKNRIDHKTSVYIGNDVWIGANAVLLGGIVIGDGAVIAAGSVVTHDIEPYTIVGGVPGRPIRKRFTEGEIEFLLDFRWWDKDPSWLMEHCDEMKHIDVLTETYLP